MNYKVLIKYLIICSLFLFNNLSHALNILHISDIHFNPFNECNISNIGNCQKLNYLIKNPIKLWYFDNTIPPNSFKEETNNSFLNENLSLCFNNKFESIDVIIITGDLLEHAFKYHFKYYKPLATEKTYTQFTTKTIHYVIEKLHKKFPSAKIYFALGNNDTDTEDYEAPSEDFLFNLKDILSNYIDKNNLQSIIDGGYFSVPINNKYQIISLNTNTFTYKSNSTRNQKITNKQLSWINNELKTLSKQNKKIIIISHIPFGIDVYATIKNNNIINTIKPEYQTQYLKILSTYKNNIVAIFNGHFHSNYNQQFNNIPVFGTIAFNTYVGNNAGSKIINLNETTGIIDYINELIINENKCLNYSIISDKLSLENYFLSLQNNDQNITNIYKKTFIGNDNKTQYINNDKYWAYYKCFITNFEKNTFENCIKCIKLDLI